MDYNEILIQIDNIRDKLYKKAPLGNISLFIGAGFSRNSKPLGATTKQYPLWEELAENIIAKLYPNDSQDERIKRKAKCHVPSYIMQVSQEYEEMFSRKELDNLIEETIPDNLYEPNQLYEQLFALPFKDIFTTNYDTLLERASSKIYGNPYKIISTADDLSGACSPRIIKLHGSFPNIKPYILTEEDYRTYPKTHKPFINTVIQSLIENDLLLIGFSGNDPNFLNWIGWIRDELCTCRQKIYLCSLNNFNEAQKRLIKKRGIEILDLNVIYSYENLKIEKTGNQYYDTYRWFFEYLNNGKKINNIRKWPLNLDRIKINSIMNNNEIAEMILQLEKYKNTYPKWIIIPEENRKYLEIKFSCLDKLLENSTLYNTIEVDIDSLIKLLNLCFWGYRMIYKSISLKACNLIRKFLDELNTLEIDKKNELISLYINMYCDARENLETSYMEKYKTYTFELENCQTYSQKNWFMKEQIIYGLKIGNNFEVFNMLNNWNLDEDYYDTNWLFKASFYIEIGETTLAKNILEKMINISYKEDESIYSKSLEGIVLYLLSFITNGNVNLSNSINERLSILKNDKCNPLENISSLENKISLIKRILPNIEEKKVKGFDPHIYHNSMKLSFEPCTVEHELVNFFDYNPLPIKVNNKYIIGIKFIEIPLINLSFESFERALTLFIRFNENKYLTSIFNRYLIYFYDDVKLKNIKSIYISSLVKSIGSIGSNNLNNITSRNTLKSLLSIVSYLIPRFGSNELNLIMNNLIKMETYENIDEKCYQLIQTCYWRTFYNLNLYINENVNILNLFFNRANIKSDNIEYCYYPNIKQIGLRNNYKDKVIIENSLIDNLFNKISFNTEKVDINRNVSKINQFERLLDIYYWELAKYKIDFFCELMEKNLDTIEIIYLYSVIQILHNNKHDATINSIIKTTKKSLKDNLQNFKLNKNLLENNLNKLNILNTLEFKNNHGLIFKEQEAIEILDSFIDMWRKNKQLIIKEIQQTNNNTIPDYFFNSSNTKKLINDVCTFLNQCIFPQISNLNKFSKNLLECYKNLYKNNFYCFELIIDRPYISKNYFQVLINSNDYDALENLLDSLVKRLLYSENITTNLQYLFTETIKSIENNKQNCLYRTLDKITYLYGQKPELFDVYLNNRLIRGIERIEKDTKIEAYKDINSALKNNNYKVLEKSDIRSFISKLTKSILSNNSLTQKQKGKIDKFIAIFSMDPLPEVYCYWENYT